MKSFWYYFYNLIVLPLLKSVLYLLSIFNPKIKDGIDGRKNLFANLKENISNLDKNKKTLWFHSSSMGEFEQAKPIIQKLKQKENINIVVTFFSPSGYKNSLKYPYADLISYLPFDNKNEISKFIDLVNPSGVIFMRYDYWPNTVWTLNNKQIPIFVVDATMAKDSKRKLPLIKDFHKNLFKNFTKILTVSEKDKLSFMDFNIPNDKLLTVGDTRFDRVYQKSITAKTKNLFRDEIVKDKKVLVLGSTWEADEEVILPAIEKILKYMNNVLIVIAPHEPTTKRLEKLEYSFSGIPTIRFSYKNDYDNEKIILIDSIGILLTLYFYADLAYVGGSFKQGIHNVIEPAVYGIPVVFGPKNKNSQEAQTMIDKGCGIVIKNKKEAYKVFKELLSNEEKRKKLGNVSNIYVNGNIGATDKIILELEKIL